MFVLLHPTGPDVDICLRLLQSSAFPVLKMHVSSQKGSIYRVCCRIVIYFSQVGLFSWVLGNKDTLHVTVLLLCWYTM